jgi:hypothetical protein
MAEVEADTLLAVEHTLAEAEYTLAEAEYTPAALRAEALRAQEPSTASAGDTAFVLDSARASDIVTPDSGPTTTAASDTTILTGILPTLIRIPGTATVIRPLTTVIKRHQ